MSAWIVEHWLLDDAPGDPSRRDIWLWRTWRTWHVQISQGPLTGGRLRWDCDDEAEARQLVADLKRAGGPIERWRACPVGGHR